MTTLRKPKELSSRVEKRNALIIRRQSQDGRARDLRLAFLDARVLANEALARSIEMLHGHLANADSPGIGFVKDIRIEEPEEARVSDGMDIAAVVEMRFKDHNERRRVRFILDSTGRVELPSSNGMIGLKASHLTIFAEKKQGLQGWHASPTPDCSAVSSTADLLPYLIHDVLLDIAVFRSWPRTTQQLSQAEKEQLNRRKHDFIKAKKLESYLPVKSSTPTYLPLAAFCRTGSIRLGDVQLSSSEIVALDDLWKEFLRPEVAGITIDRDDLVFDICRQLEHAGVNWIPQLSQKRLRSKANALPPGEYYLLVSLKNRPNEKSDCDAVSRLLRDRNYGAKGKLLRYRKGLFKFFTASEFHQAGRLAEFCHILKVVVPNG